MSEAITAIAATAEIIQPDVPLPLTRPVAAGASFPMDALGSLEGAAQAIHECIQAPLALCAQSVLGAACLAVQGHANVVLPYGGSCPISLFLLSIAKSGERKSSVDSIALKPIRDRERELWDRYRHDEVAFETEKAIWEAKRTAILAGGKKPDANSMQITGDIEALGPEPHRPLKPMILCSDSTIEGYYKLTADGQPSMGMFSAEGGTFVGGVGMSKDHRTKTASALSSLWDGDPVKRGRSGDGMMFLADRRLALHLMMQHGIANELLGDDGLADQGLLWRMLLVAPPTTMGTRMFKGVDQRTHPDLKAYHEHLAGILKVPLPIRDDTRNELEPGDLLLDGEAKALWTGYHDNVEARLAPGGDLEVIDSFAAKIAEHAARLAAVLALWNDLNARTIDGESMMCGIELANHYLGETKRLRDASQVTPHLAACQEMWDWIEGKYRDPILTMEAILQRGPNRLREKSKAQSVIGTLIDHRYLTPAAKGVAVQGRQRREAWEIHGRQI